MKRLFGLSTAAICVALLWAGTVRAQEQGQDQNQGQQQTPPNQGATQAQGPIPAYRSPLAGAANEDEDTTTEITPDNRSLTGVQPFGLGMQNQHSYWQPHVDIFLTVDSNPTLTTGNSGWGTWSSLSGGVDMHKISANNDFELDYVGGGMISNNSSASNGVVQELAFTDKILFRRWALTFFDYLSYLPESSSGFGGLGTPFSGGGSDGGTLGTGQSLLVGRGQNLGNQFDTQADVFLTARSSLTFVGGYSTLKYFDSDLLNYGTVDARAGYNYQIDRKNTIGLVYTFSDTNYGNFDQSITEHTFQVAYGRRVTGRLAFQIAAGPQVATFQIPITTGSGSTDGGTTSSTTNLYWSLNANLMYALQRTTFSLAYSHGVEAGSGVLAGSEADTVNGYITHQVTRRFTAGITGGYSRNRGLAVVGTTDPLSTQTFDYWYGGGNLSYPLGRTIALSLSYQLQYQTSGTAFCIGTPCSTDVIRHTISMGVNWRDRPHRF